MAARETQEGDVNEEVVRLLALLVRLQCESQSDTILALKAAGFGPTRIATLLGTTPGTVNVTLNRSKKRSVAKNEK